MSEHIDVQKDIMTKSGWEPEKNYRNRQSLLAALLVAASKMTDEAYAGLDEFTKDWCDAAAAANKYNREHPDDKRLLPDFNGHDAEADDHSVQEFDDRTEQGVIDGSETSERQEESAHDAGGMVEIEHTQTQTHQPKKRVTKTKTSKTVKAKKDKAPSRGLNEWGVVRNTKSDKVCQMMARPEGTTQKEIAETVGQTHYNLVNRLVRRSQGKSYTIKYDGTRIWLIRKEVERIQAAE